MLILSLVEGLKSSFGHYQVQRAMLSETCVDVHVVQLAVNCSEIRYTGYSYLNIQCVLCYAGFFTPTPPPSCYDGQLRFSNTSSGSTPTGAIYYQGRVEVCINGTFGAICDVGWDRLDAQVACREFGYNSTSFGL